MRSSQVSVFREEEMELAALELLRIQESAVGLCQEDLRQAERLLEETRTEERTSHGLLEMAQLLEAERAAVLAAREAELAQAVMAEAAAIASGQPAVIAVESARAAEALARAEEARQAFEEARCRRERMERRRELAARCGEIAGLSLESQRVQYTAALAEAAEVVQRGRSRLAAAAGDLRNYHGNSPAREAAGEWLHWEPEEKRPVRPDQVHDRLNVSESVQGAVLAYLYATDPGFRAAVDRLRRQLEVPGREAAVELQVRKNVAGRLCEELVIRAFAPLGEEIRTQENRTLEDGGFTKIDMTLYGLKVPLILGRGRQMGAREGGSLAIEVKSGEAAYLRRELDHMCRQAEGHQGHSASCVVCTRDIRDLPPGQEQALREALRQAGSPILGMLPRKEELDRSCIRFVWGEVDGGV